MIRHDIQILGTEAVIQYSASHLFVNCYRAQISTTIKILVSVHFDYTYLCLVMICISMSRIHQSLDILRPATIRNVTGITRIGCFKNIPSFGHWESIVSVCIFFSIVGIRTSTTKFLWIFYPPCSISVLEWSLTRPEMPR